MIAVLTRIFGLHNLELAEDVVRVIPEGVAELEVWTFHKILLPG
jgi:hypothetical protein